MGAADFQSAVEIRGTKEEVFAIAQVMKTYATTKREQYREKRNCPYLTHINICGASEFGLHNPMLNLSDDEILAFIESKNCEISLEAGGPYGVFNGLSHIRMFHEMAEAAPNAYFKGAMGGFDVGGDYLAGFELKDQRLSCKYATNYHGELDEDEDYDDDNWDEEDYEKEPDWDTEVIYDPINKKNVRK